MRKPIHPIRKIARRFHQVGEGEQEDSWRESVIARNVKPLLDALERDGHGLMLSERKDVMRCKHIGGCIDCRLVGAWKAKP